MTSHEGLSGCHPPGTSRPGGTSLNTAGLFDLAYDELRRLARGYLRRERPDHTLEPTGLVHEAYMKLSGSLHPEWRGREMFLAIAARAMRQILVDHARAVRAAKRSGQTVTFTETLAGGAARSVDLLALDQALERLGRAAPNRARLVELYFFAGLTVTECAGVLDLGERTVYRQLRSTKAWLQSTLDEPVVGGSSVPPMTGIP